MQMFKTSEIAKPETDNIRGLSLAAFKLHEFRHDLSAVPSLD
jgi:hypothetical protein